MNESKMAVNAEIVRREGVSKKTNKLYTMTFLCVHTELYGDVEILLDTRKDRAGIILDLLLNT